jgi:hypothetical protein
LGHIVNAFIVVKKPAENMVDEEKESQVYQPSEHSDDPGEHQVEGILIDAKAIAQRYGAGEVSVKKSPESSPERFQFRFPSYHATIYEFFRALTSHYFRLT